MTIMEMNVGAAGIDEVPLTVESHICFAEVFHRLFKIGIYYPIGHVVLDQAASKFIQQLREKFPSSPAVTIEVDSSRLMVEKTALPEDVNSAKELVGMLSNMGIKSIVMQRTITLKQLLQFVRAILAWRVQLESASSFIDFELVDIPETVQVTQQRYLVDTNAVVVGSVGRSSSQTVAELCSALSRQGLNDWQIHQCQNLLTSLATQKRGEWLDIRGFPNATWHDVQDLLYKIVTGGYDSTNQESAIVDQNDVTVLASIFDSLERRVTDRSAKDTINLLISHLTGTGPTGIKKISATKPAEVSAWQNIRKPKVSAAEIFQFVEDNRVPLKVLEKITSTDRCEIISVILQLLLRKDGVKASDSCERMFTTLVSSSMTSKERHVLSGGIKYFAEIEAEEIFRKTLSMVLTSLRNPEKPSSLDFLVDLWSKLPYTLHVKVWPFAVNELLAVGICENNLTFCKLLEIVSHFPLNRMRTLRSQLEELDTFREKNLAPAIFRPSYLYSYLFFSFLLETSLGEAIAERVLQELQNDPQDKFIAVVAPMLQISDPHHLEFIHLYLAQVKTHSPPLTLKMAAGEIILAYLENINEEQKEQSWLPKTIQAMADLQVRGAVDILGRITTEKKMGLVPVWPKSCRMAAEYVLEKMSNRQLSRLL